MDAAFGYLAARLLAALLALLAVSAIIFAAVELLPGDPAAQLLGTYATPERIEAVREQLDLDDPAPICYARWLGGALQGDLGRPVRVDQPVADLIDRPALNTAVLSAVAFAPSAPPRWSWPRSAASTSSPAPPPLSPAPP